MLKISKKTGHILRNLIRLFFNYEVIKTKKNPNLDSALRNIFAQGIKNVFDVGANIGQFSQNIRKLGFKNKIFSFEPVSETFKILKTTNKKNIEFYNFGFGETQESILINVTNSTDLSSVLTPNIDGENLLGKLIKIRKTELIKINKFDSFFDPKIYSSNLLKVDTQGFDLNVLKGAKSSLKYIDYILVEAAFITIYKNMPTFFDINQYLTQNGFKLMNIFPLSSDKNGNIIECDCIYQKDKNSHES